MFPESIKSTTCVTDRTCDEFSVLFGGEPADTAWDMTERIRVSTYNVHRWMGVSGRSAPDIRRAGAVISELEADVIALQEVLRPVAGPDPLQELAEALGLHYCFTRARVHRRGELGNALLSRSPIRTVEQFDLSFNPVEQRVATSAEIEVEGVGCLRVISTHLALMSRTRHRQVSFLLEQLQEEPTILLGDLNLWRRCKADRTLERELIDGEAASWPASYPAPKPMLSLDRVYSRGARVIDLQTHDTPRARRASDHLPVVAEIELPAVA